MTIKRKGNFMKRTTTRKRWSLSQVLPFLLVIGGVIGLLCSYILSYEKLEIIKDPTFVPSCNLNPVISCGSVMTSHQADFFGFPNSWIGLFGFGLVICVGMAILAGAQFKRWFWLTFETGMLLAMIFAYWLLTQSVFVIQALCPFCLTVDVVLTIMFWYLTLHIVGKGYVRLPTRLQTIARFFRSYHAESLAVWFIFLLVVILHHFWYFYGQYI